MFILLCFLRSNSTGSLLSVVSYDSVNIGQSETGNVSESSGPSLEAYIEAFLITLITLNNKRRYLPLPLTGLLALSPMAGKIGTTPEEKTFRVS